LLTLGRGGVHFGVVGFFAKTFINGFLQRQGRSDVESVVGLDEDHFTIGLLDAKVEGAFS